jgi:predicted amidohydrolase
VSSVRIAAAQTPDFVDDVPAALAYAAEVVRQAADARAALVCFPEAFLQGYRTDATFVAEVAIRLDGAAFREVLKRLPASGPTIVLGLIEEDGGAHHNTAVVIKDRTLLGRYRKAHLLAGETAFVAGRDAPVFDADGLRFGVNICHDTNFSEAARRPVAAGARAHCLSG